MTNTNPKIGIMLMGHGSRDPDAIAEFTNFSEKLHRNLGAIPFASGFLEFAKPTIRTGLEALKSQQVTHIYAVPVMLLTAGHVKHDLPTEINTFLALNPLITITYGQEPGSNPKIMNAATALIDQALNSSRQSISKDQTLLLVVGQGTSDPDINADLTKISCLLGKELGLGMSAIAFSSVAEPLLNQALDQLAPIGFKRIIVFPYFLFTGILVKRIYSLVDEAALTYPHIEFIKVRYLSDHDAVIAEFVDRIHRLIS